MQATPDAIIQGAEYRFEFLGPDAMERRGPSGRRRTGYAHVASSAQDRSFRLELEPVMLSFPPSRVGASWSI
jgi:hypothetical protein